MSDLRSRSDSRHTTVLCNELVDAVLGDAAGTYIDATFGRGGHSQALLRRLAPSARLLVIDRDTTAIAAAQRLCEKDRRVSAVQARFSELESVAAEHQCVEVSGVMFDLGVSSPQIDEPLRGFSFRADGPLDMRMDQTRGFSAADWLNSASIAAMAQVFRDYGEERFAKRIAQAIERARPLHTTEQLVAVVEAAQPRPDRHKHAATRVFQAIRIHVNDELEELREGLSIGWSLLRVSGCLGVISFHSLEDRIVKRAFAALSKPAQLPRRLPVMESQRPPLRASARKPMRASAAEVAQNSRSRSAMLRSVERIL